MADLLHAAQTRIKYAANVIDQDPAAALGHIVKAQGFLARAAAPLAPVTVDDDEPVELSADQSTAFAQIASALGFPIIDPDGDGPLGSVLTNPAGLLAAAAPLQNQQLTLMGIYGTPDQHDAFPNADFTLYERYNQPVPAGQAGGGWEPKPEYANTGGWAAYVATL